MASESLRYLLEGWVSRRFTGGSHAPSLTCLQTLASTISFTGDPEVPTTRRIGPEEESEPRSNRLALYRIVYLNLRESTFYALG
jgi:hypothetical protein